MKKIVSALISALLFLTTLSAESLKIDFRCRLDGDDGKNYLNWQSDTSKIKDSFDAVSGASKKMSTKLLREVQAEEKKRLFPKGLYALLLFAVTSPEQMKTDMLTVEAEDRKLTISFIHRGNAYKITTDEKGRLDLLTGFTFAEGLAINSKQVFTIKPEYLQGYEEKSDEKEADKKEAKIPTPNPLPESPAGSTDWNLLDWEKVTFIPDTYDEKAEKIWNGKLKTTLKDGVLTISGKLKKVEKPKKSPDNLDDIPPTSDDKPTDKP
ncbi:MAG: hypothetical protein II684_08750, partial [Treponema sp.]|nr:hypothetical protein [Treponema sp.]